MRVHFLVLSLLLMVGEGCSQHVELKAMSTQVLVKELGDSARRGAPAPQIQDELRRRGDAAIDGLAPLLADADPQVAAVAVEVLQSIGTDRALDRLVAWALPNLTDPTGETKLPGPGFRRLVAIGRPVLPALNRAYRPDLPFKTRRGMIEVVFFIGDPAGLPLLEAALAGRDEDVWAMAGEAIGKVGGPSAYQRLASLLHSADVERRAGAIWGFGRLGEAAAVAPLLEVLLAEDQPILPPIESAPSRGRTLHSEAARVIDELTGEPSSGDVAKIRAWLERHPPRR